MKKIILTFFLILSAASARAQVQWPWQQKLGNITQSFAINPLNPEVIYCSGKISYDGGDTWTQRGVNGPYTGKSRSMLFCPADTNVILSCGDGIVKSDDGGRTWRRVIPYPVGSYGPALDYDHQNPTTFYFLDVSTSKFYVSSDTGSTWTVRSTIGSSFYGYSLAVNPFNSNIILAGSRQLARSNDNGHNWNMVGPSANWITSIVWDKEDSNRVFAVLYYDKLIESTDAGLTWFSPTNSQLGFFELTMDPLDGSLYGGSDYSGRIYKSYDKGKSWQLFGNSPNSSGQSPWQIRVSNTQKVFADFYGPGLYSLQPQTVGKLTGVITDSAIGLPVSFASIVVKETGDNVIVGSDDGSFAMGLPPGTYTLEIKVGYNVKTISNVTISANTTTNLNVNIPIDHQLHSITGRIHNNQNLNIPGKVMLFVTHPDGSGFQLIDTTENGEFTFSNMLTTNLYFCYVFSPAPYVRRITPQVSFSSLMDITVPTADILYVNDSGDPGLDHFGEGWDSPSFSVWDVRENGEYVPPNIVRETNKRTALWYTPSDTQAYSRTTLKSLLNFCNNGYNLIVSGNKIAEFNASTELFKKNFGIGFDSNFTPTYPDHIAGIAGTIGDSLDGYGDFDVLKIMKSGVHPVFECTNSLSGNSLLAGVTVDNTGNGGKAVFLGFDLIYGFRLQKNL